jgi:hypothetical protein
MSVVSEAVRATVVERAGHRCEYCHFPTRGQVGTFPVDHVTPRSTGGATTLDNLALACPRCNGHKWKHCEGLDRSSGESCRLFNPRRDSWAEHFCWSQAQRGVLEGLTAVGRATIEQLQMNDAEVVALRCLLGAVGLFPEVGC